MHLPRNRSRRISGWWGAARKINYTGDWLMGLSWCLFAGNDSLIPYFYRYRTLGCAMDAQCPFGPLTACMLRLCAPADPFNRWLGSIYFFILLCHRAWRDHVCCKDKYGDDWAQYTKAVPAVFVPGIF
jgi:delta14-sterol reductase